MINPIEVLERAGVNNYRALWAKRIIQLNSREDLQKVMAQFPELQVTSFAVGGWFFTTEKLEEKFMAV